MKFSQALLAGALLAPSAQAEFSAAPVLRVTRKAPLFERPSSKSKLVAEADPDTPILGRSLSPQGSWILVEDSDGNQAWMPTQRTNYQEINLVRDQLLPSVPVLTQSMPDEEVPSLTPDFDAPTQQAPNGSQSWELSAAYREGITDNVTTVYPIGISYIQAGAAQGVGLRLDLDISKDKLAHAWRVSFLGRYPWEASFFRELDVGYERRNAVASRGGLSVGYSLGVGVSSRFAFSLRGGLFLGSEREWSGELRCRYAF